MHKEEVNLLEHISQLRKTHAEAGISVVLYAGKARLETDMPEVRRAALADSLFCY